MEKNVKIFSYVKCSKSTEFSTMVMAKIYICWMAFHHGGNWLYETISQGGQKQLDIMMEPLFFHFVDDLTKSYILDLNLWLAISNHQTSPAMWFFAN